MEPTDSWERVAVGRSRSSMGVGTFTQSQTSRFAAERNDGGKVSKLMAWEPVTVGLCSSGARSQRLSPTREIGSV